MNGWMRRFGTFAVAMFTLVAATGASGAFPDRPVKLVVPFAPGATPDILARMLAERLSAQWGQPVVVENRPGGSTIPATELVAKSPADGHTILLTTDSTFSINPHGRKPSIGAGKHHGFAVEPRRC